jgi:hypothetical protein
MDEKGFLVNKIDSTEEHSTESWNYMARLLVQANMIIDIGLNCCPRRSFPEGGCLDGAHTLTMLFHFATTLS